MIVPKIDYKLLGQALAEYEKRGYHYVEVPWTVTERVIRATLPPQYPSLTMAVPEIANPDNYYPYNQSSHLVGSAEQGFLALNLAPGAYVGITPCFRPEPFTDVTHQIMFMKVELFVTDKHRSVDRVLGDAQEVMALFAGKRPVIKITDEGADLEIGGIEVGSYGEREFEDQKWVYGTGLALPRFSVARAIDSIT